MEQRQADGGQSMGLRERKRRATRDAIERAAIALVSERGYDNVTVAQICELSSVSQGTFFNYFRTKDAAIVGIGEYDLDADSGGIVRLGKRHRGAADRARQRNALAHAAVLGQRVRLRQRFSQYRGGVF